MVKGELEKLAEELRRSSDRLLRLADRVDGVTYDRVTYDQMIVDPTDALNIVYKFVTSAADVCQINCRALEYKLFGEPPESPPATQPLPETLLLEEEPSTLMPEEEEAPSTLPEEELEPKRPRDHPLEDDQEPEKKKART